MRAVYAVDVGKTKEPSKFAWARVEPETASGIVASPDIRQLASRLERDLKYGYSVALGFEAPAFIPVPESADNLSRGRNGEGSRSCFAPAGSTVAVLRLHQAAWLLRKLFDSCGDECTFTLDCEDWPPALSSPVFFCWEAFVSGDAHGASHTQDAATAVMAFARNEHGLASANAVFTDHPFSLIGAAALWSGWTTDVEALHASTLVIKPATAYTGPVEDAG